MWDTAFSCVCLFVGWFVCLPVCLSAYCKRKTYLGHGRTSACTDSDVKSSKVKDQSQTFCSQFALALRHQVDLAAVLQRRPTSAVLVGPVRVTSWNHELPAAWDLHGDSTANGSSFSCFLRLLTTNILKISNNVTFAHRSRLIFPMLRALDVLQLYSFHVACAFCHTL